MRTRSRQALRQVRRGTQRRHLRRSASTETQRNRPEEPGTHWVRHFASGLQAGKFLCVYTASQANTGTLNACTATQRVTHAV